MFEGDDFCPGPNCRQVAHRDDPYQTVDEYVQQWHRHWQSGRDGEDWHETPLYPCRDVPDAPDINQFVEKIYRENT